MVDDRWSIRLAVLFGVLLGPPSRVAFDGMLGDDFPDTGRELMVYLAMGMLLGAVILGLLAVLRNRVLSSQAIIRHIDRRHYL